MLNQKLLFHEIKQLFKEQNNNNNKNTQSNNNLI